MADAGRPVGRRGRRARLRRTWGQRFVVLGGVVSAAMLGAAAVALGYGYNTAEQIDRVSLGNGVLSESENEGEPQNYLVLGVDFADPDDPLAVGRDGVMRSDTIMVLRVDPTQRSAELLSLPRDLWVPYGDGDHQRINTALQRGNGRPDVLIQVINDYFGIPIHHYLQVDFSGFRDLVSAIDGVPIYFPYPARDRHSGLYVDQTGCVTLNPEQALAYARSRYYEQLIDDDWESDPTADLGRIQRQQAFIRAAIDRAIARGARNPGTAQDLVEAALEVVAVDDALTLGDILDLAQRFRSFDPSSLVSYALPVAGDTTAGGASILRLVEAQAEPILARFRGDDGELTPISVRVTVLNGSGETAEGEAAADALGEAGFTVVATDQADTYGQDQTTIRYPEGQLAQAELLERWLVNGAVLEEVPAFTVPGEDGTTDGTTGSEVDETDGSTGIVLVTGSDWGGLLSEPRSAPSTTAGTEGTDGTGDGTTTTTATTLPTFPSRPGDSTGTTVSDPSATDETTTTTLPLQEC